MMVLVTSLMKVVLDVRMKVPAITMPLQPLIMAAVIMKEYMIVTETVLQVLIVLVNVEALL